MNSRRLFLRQSLAVTAGFTGLSAFLKLPVEAAPLVMERGDDDWLEVPEGFSARIISRKGERMSDDLFVPGKADGMAAFSHKGKVVLIRNHENSPNSTDSGAFGDQLELLSKLDRKRIYDYGFGKTPALGGTTTVVFNEEAQRVEEQYLSLAGTNRNCAGGPTPWQSWLTCEEDVTPMGGEAEKFHGYTFEVPVQSRGLADPVPLKEMGRFNHEAVCVDPKTGIVYLTEDRHDGLIYRFIPNTKGKLARGGTLQALCIHDQKGFDTRNWEGQYIKPGEQLDTIWITVTNVDSPNDDLRNRGHEQGAARFARGEGMWFGNNEVYFACTNGGLKKAGQVFRYIPSPREGGSRENDFPGKLSLFAEPNDTNILQYCDNLTVSPWGDVVFVEDRNGAHMRGITPQGSIYNIARNVGSRSELAGVCFSPSGKTLFVNIQDQGLTYAVTGPWGELRKI